MCTGNSQYGILLRPLRCQGERASKLGKLKASYSGVALLLSGSTPIMKLADE